MAIQKGKQPSHLVGDVITSHALFTQVIVCAVLVAVQWLTPVHALQVRLVSGVMAPLQQAVQRVLFHVPVVSSLSDAWSAHQQLEALRGERDALVREVVRLKSTEEELHSLQATLGVLPKDHHEQVLAPLLLYPRPQVLRGSVDAIASGNPVFSSKGLIGVIGEVALHSATLTLLTSDELRLPVMHQASTAQGILTAHDGIMTVTFLSLLPAIQPGDMIVSMATKDGVPAGELVGKVSAVDTKLSDPVTKVRLESSVFPISDTQVVIVKGAP